AARLRFGVDHRHHHWHLLFDCGRQPDDVVVELLDQQKAWRQNAAERTHRRARARQSLTIADGGSEPLDWRWVPRRESTCGSRADLQIATICLNSPLVTVIIKSTSSLRNGNRQSA